MSPRASVRSVTIVVSGYAPVRATAIYIAGECHGAISGAYTLRTLPPGITEPVARWDGSVRCYRCLRTVDRLDDGRLGMRSFCIPCVDELIAACERANGRLPRHGEFYCARCTRIVPAFERGEDGRWRCRRCRGAASTRSKQKRLSTLGADE